MLVGLAIGGDVVCVPNQWWRESAKGFLQQIRARGSAGDRASHSLLECPDALLDCRVIAFKLNDHDGQLSSRGRLGFSVLRHLNDTPSMVRANPLYLGLNSESQKDQKPLYLLTATEGN